MTVLWLVCVLLALGAGIRGGLSSCAREHGDRVQAQTWAVRAIWWALLAIGCGIAAWGWS